MIDDASTTLRTTDARPPVGRKRRLVDILADQGKLDRREIGRVLEMQHRAGLRFGEASLRLNLISRGDLGQAIATQFGLPHLLADNGQWSSELVLALAPRHPRAEEIRALRGHLMMRRERGEWRGRRLALVSAAHGEGRSYLCANLAVAFAQLGLRTLLVDADLRRPRQHRIFDVPDHLGLVALLDGRAGSEAVVPLAGLGPLHLLPAGASPPNPAELLSRGAFAETLDALQPGFDVVLLDTSAAETSADAHSVACRSGHALVVARRGQPRVAAVDALLSQLAEAGVRSLGMVFNAC